MDVDFDCDGDSVVGMVKRVVVGGDIGRKSDMIGMRRIELMPEFDDFDTDEDI